MKYVLCFLLMLCAAAPAFCGDAGERRFEIADKELNSVYRQLQEQYKSEPEFLAKLKAAQRAWIQFRDAHLEARFPLPDKQAMYGSVYPVCAEEILADLTEARTAQLRFWLEGVEEGDACAGSAVMHSE